MRQSDFVVATALAFAASATLAYLIDRLFFKTINPPSRYGGIDGLRGVLSFLVFSHHYACTMNYAQYGVWSPEPHAFNVLNGPVGVALFFMITGFLFWQKLEASRGRLAVGDFYLNRVVRIAPLYWFHLGLMATLIGFAQGLSFFSRLRLSDALPWIFFSLTGRPDIAEFPLTWRLDAGASWTLAYEFLFYASLPLLALVFKLPWRYVVMSFVAVILTYGYLNPTNIFGLPINTKYFAFFLGGFLAVYAERSKTLRRFAGSRLGSLVAASLLLLIYLNFRDIENPCVWLFLTAFFVLVASGSTLFGLLKARGVLFLGSISYSLYLLHGLTLYVAFTLLWPRALVAFDSAEGVLFLIGIALILVLVSSLTYALIEQPPLSLYRRFRRRSIVA